MIERAGCDRNYRGERRGTRFGTRRQRKLKLAAAQAKQDKGAESRPSRIESELAAAERARVELLTMSKELQDRAQAMRGLEGRIRRSEKELEAIQGRLLQLDIAEGTAAPIRLVQPAARR